LILTCADIVKLVTDYLEGALTPAERRRFEGHVAICPPCRAFLDQTRTTIELVGGLREEDVPPEMEEHLLTAFRDWRGDE
jgi:predicted anti-sigma-YlaC factor YlaD